MSLAELCYWRLEWVEPSTDQAHITFLHKGISSPTRGSCSVVATKCKVFRYGPLCVFGDHAGAPPLSAGVVAQLLADLSKNVGVKFRGKPCHVRFALCCHQTSFSKLSKHIEPY